MDELALRDQLHHLWSLLPVHLVHLDLLQHLRGHLGGMQVGTRHVVLGGLIRAVVGIGHLVEKLARRVDTHRSLRRLHLAKVPVLALRVEPFHVRLPLVGKLHGLRNLLVDHVLVAGAVTRRHLLRRERALAMHRTLLHLLSALNVMHHNVARVGSREGLMELWLLHLVHILQLHSILIVLLQIVM
mmetsp:Transcript_28385/g.27329  ORF Transcript_28385/g.27329 Transcript_28385/m.27329 type:complete len:186 (+) Transcript_28385:216-773(+)